MTAPGGQLLGVLGAGAVSLAHEHDLLAVHGRMTVVPGVWTMTV